MKYDSVSAGAGGQGALVVSAAIAMRSGLFVKQLEEHGMAQRGGSVVSHVSLSDRPVFSSIIPHGRADLIVSMEPLEAPRYLPCLALRGTLLSSSEPVRNFPSYPDLDDIVGEIRALPESHLVDAQQLARDAGLARASNLVMVGAASAFLSLESSEIEAAVREGFASRGETVVEANLATFRAGREAVACVPA